MPSVSRAQQAKMAICEHDPAHAKGECPDMTRQQLHDFAATPTHDLPAHAPKRKPVIPKKKR